LFRPLNTRIEQRDDGGFNGITYSIGLVYTESRLDDDSNTMLAIADGESVLIDMARKFFGAEDIIGLGLKMGGDIQLEHRYVEGNDGLITVVAEIDIEVPYNACAIAVPIDSFGGGTGGACLPVSIQNTSGDSFGLGTSGGVYVIPNITIQNGVESSVFAYSGTVYTNFGAGGFANIVVQNSTPLTLSAFTANVSGGDYIYTVQDSTLFNTDGDDIGVIPATTDATLPDIVWRNSNGETVTHVTGVYPQNGYGVIQNIKVINDAISGQSQTLPFSGVVHVNFSASTSTSIAYQRPTPQSNGTSYANFDVSYNITNGVYDWNVPSEIGTLAQVDFGATESDLRGTYFGASGDGSDSISPTILKSNNAFGNKYRFTDDLGNASDSSTTDLHMHCDFQNHSFAGATNDYVIDHLTGLGYYITNVTNGTKFNMDTTDVADGQTWEQWVNFIETGLTVGLYSDFRLPSLEESESGVHGAFSTKKVYAQKILPSTRRYMPLANSISSTDCICVHDTSSTSSFTTAIAKSGSNGFPHRISYIYAIRTHY
jgi:hypothetical protein